MRTEQKIWEILGPPYQRMAIALFVLMLIGMLLEMLGVGLVVPAMSALTNPEMLRHFPVLRGALDWLGNPSQRELIAWGLTSLLTIYAVKTLFLLLLAWWQCSFVAGVQADVSRRLFTIYLDQPWTFHLQRNSAPLIRNCTSEVQSFSHACSFALTIATESLVLVGLGAMLLVTEPAGTLVIAAMLGGSSLWLHSVTHQRLLRWGEQRLNHDGKRVQHLQQGLGGAKDVKLLGREKSFISIYDTHNQANAKLHQKQMFLQSVPRLWYELLAVAGLVALGLYLLRQGRDPSALLPSLAFFTAAAFRLLPSANRLLLALQNLRFTKPVVDTLHGELRLSSESDKAKAHHDSRFHDRIRLRNVTFVYPKAVAPAVSDISLTIEKGAAVGLIGGSGAGKSTLVDLILGLVRPSGGVIEVDGLDICNDLRGWQSQIGYVPQTIFLTDDTIRRNVAFGVPDDEIDDAAVHRAVMSAQLTELIESLPTGYATLVGERGVRLSGGQRQRIGIARALYHDPSILVLDEATSALDAATESDVMEAVNGLHGKKTLIIVAHRLSTVSHCDRLFQLDNGRLVRTGSFQELTATAQ
jgi:ABC-type multidrug transport system fused ATPase/permease subunit